MTSPWSPSTFGPPAATRPPMIGALIDFNQAETGSETQPSRPESSIFAGTEAFSQTMRDSGLDPGGIIPDGQLHRFDVPGDRPKSRNGWYVFFDDGIQAGRFGSWKTGQNISWCSGNQSEFSAEEKAAYKAKMEAARLVRDAGQQRVAEECREWCKTTWATAKAAPDDHPYLIKKQVKAHGLRVMGDALMVPIKALSGQLQGIQFIKPDGSKKFKIGTVKQGHFHLIGKPIDSTMIVCEGYATGASIHQATGYAVLVAFDAGNLKPVAESIHKQRPQLKLIIAADDDHATEGNPGLAKATEAARIVGGALIVPVFPDTRGPKDTDFNDLAQLAGLEAVRLQLTAYHGATETANTGEPARQSLFISAAELLQEDMTIEYRVDEVIEEDSTGLLVGASGVGKSFLCVDMVLAVATGGTWAGHGTKKGLVVYFTGEGRKGFKRRVEAWRVHNQKTVADLELFHTSRSTIDLVNDRASVAVEIRQFEAVHGQSVALIVIDTLARHLDGDENSTQDMGAFIKSVDGLREAFPGSAALIVHHPGHNGDRARGAYCLKAALDFEMQCGVGNISFPKMKDGETPPDIGFELKQVKIGIQPNGKPITSCIVEYGESSEQSKAAASAKQFTSPERMAIKALMNLSSGPLKDTDADGKFGALIGDWRQKFYELQLAQDPDRKQATLKKAFDRAGETLAVKGVIRESGHTRFFASDTHQSDIQTAVFAANLLEKGQGT